MASAYTTQHVNWEVRWIGARGKVNVRKFGHDYVEAVRVYTLAVQAGKRAATLRSANIGFPPPPEKYADLEKYPRGRSKRTGKIVYGVRVKEPHTYLVRMRQVNAKGLWWCPFCMKMRKFVKKPGFTYEGIFVDKVHYACPMCAVMHDDGSVRKYNPIVTMMEMRGRARKRSRRSRRRRRG